MRVTLKGANGANKAPTEALLVLCWRCFSGILFLPIPFVSEFVCKLWKSLQLGPKKVWGRKFSSLSFMWTFHKVILFEWSSSLERLCCVTRALETHLHNWWIIPPLLWESHPVLLLSVKSTSQKKILHFYYRAQSWFWEWKSRIADDWLDWAQVSWDLKGFDPKKGRFSRMTNKKERFSLICLLSKLYFLFHILLMHYYMEQLLLLLLPCVVLLCLLSFH